MLGALQSLPSWKDRTEDQIRSGSSGRPAAPHFLTAVCTGIRTNFTNSTNKPGLGGKNRRILLRGPVRSAQCPHCTTMYLPAAQENTKGTRQNSESGIVDNNPKPLNAFIDCIVVDWNESPRSLQRQTPHQSSFVDLIKVHIQPIQPG